MTRWTASAKWAAGPALDGRCGTPLVLSLSEGLGVTTAVAGLFVSVRDDGRYCARLNCGLNAKRHAAHVRVLGTVTIAYLVRASREAIDASGIGASTRLSVLRVAVRTKQPQILGPVIAGVSRLVIKDQGERQIIPLQWPFEELARLVVALVAMALLSAPSQIVTLDPMPGELRLGHT